MDELQQKISYKFEDIRLLERALTHPSIISQENNQRLEFLGDSVIGMVVARLLYDLFPEEQEGELARRQAALIRGETLAKLAREIELGKFLKIASSEERAGGRDNSSNLEDALEALIGAIYLDGGVEAAEKIIFDRWRKLAAEIKSAPKDAKTALQEFAQGRGLPLPLYETTQTTGSAHAPIFTVRVGVQGFAPATAQAASKKSAQQTAAKLLLERLQNDG